MLSQQLPIIRGDKLLRSPIRTVTSLRGSSTPWKYTTKFKYDDLGNTIKIIYPDETQDSNDNPSKQINYDYIQGTVTLTNERGFDTVETRDAWGGLSKGRLKMLII